MKKLLLIILSICMMMWTAPTLAGDEVRQLTLQEKIMSHPDVVQMGDNWFRIVIKVNISETEYDWRFDRRMIEVAAGHINIGHRLEQNSGNSPNSNWVIEYLFVDKLSDGTLDYYDKDRYLSVEVSKGAWFKIMTNWPDEFRYPDLLTEEEALELYKKELEWWYNKL